MSSNLFQTRPLSGTSFFQKLFKQFPQENAVIELNNLLANKDISNISRAEVSGIESKYQLILNREFQLNLEEFYATYLNDCLADSVLTDAEMNELNHLKRILQLDDKTIEKLHLKIGEVVYRKSFQEAVKDGRLTQGEKAFLNNLENTLQLPKQIADKISTETRTAFIEKYVAQIVADQRLSPAEETELYAIANSLNVEVQLDDKTKNQLQKLKLYWALENLDLPIIQPDISLQKSELCHFRLDNVKWHELRSVQQRVSYGGYSTSFKIAKGFYLRCGSYSSRSYSVDTMQHIDTGTLYLTNKRIIFTGAKKNSNIRIDKILDFKPYVDGVEIGKETGKSPTLEMAQQADIFCMMLERLLNER